MKSLRQKLILLYSGFDQQITQVLDSLEQSEIEPLLQLAKQNKLFPQVYSVIKDRFVTSEDHQLFYEQQLNRRAEVLKTLGSLQALHTTDSDFVVLKGPGMEVYYPPGKHRHFVDLDISVPSIEHFWIVGNVLLQNEFEQYSTMNFFHNPVNSQLIGGARFDSTDPETRYRQVELLVGGFLICTRTFLPYDTFASEIIWKTIEGIRIPVPTRTGNFIIYLCELQTRDLLLRDLFDVHFLIEGAEEKLDISSILHNIDHYNLHHALEKLYQAFEAEPGLQTPHLIRELVKLSNSKEKGCYRGYFRSQVIPFLRKHSPHPYRELFLLWLRHLSIKLNDADRMLSLLKFIDVTYGPNLYFKNGAFAYFMKVNNISLPWQIKKFGRYHMALTPIGSFIVTRHALFSDEELDEADQFVQQSLHQA